MKDAIVFRRFYYDAVKLLPEELQLKAIKAVLDYAFYETEISKDEELYVSVYFLGVKPYIDNKIKLWGSGENHWNWNGGITDENQVARNSAEMKQWRIDVFKRDNYTCRHCGQNGKINAHHIKEFAKFPDLRYDVDNGLTLCVPCHKKVHAKK